MPLLRRRSSHGLPAVLGVGDMFSTAYGNVGSSIYYALGVTALYAGRTSAERPCPGDSPCTKSATTSPPTAMAQGQSLHKGPSLFAMLDNWRD